MFEKCILFFFELGTVEPNYQSLWMIDDLAATSNMKIESITNTEIKDELDVLNINSINSSNIDFNFKGLLRRLRPINGNDLLID